MSEQMESEMTADEAIIGIYEILSGLIYGAAMAFAGIAIFTLIIWLLRVR